MRPPTTCRSFLMEAGWRPTFITWVRTSRNVNVIIQSACLPARLLIPRLDFATCPQVTPVSFATKGLELVACLESSNHATTERVSLATV